MVGNPYGGFVNGIQSGTAHYFIRGSQNQWIEIAEVSPSDPAEGMSFGGALAMDNEFAVVGAGGSAYIFENIGAGTWVERAKLVGDSAQGQNFGATVGISNDTVVVGEADDVYVYTRDGTSWPLTQILSPEPARPQFFGETVSISGDVLAVRADLDPESDLYFLAYVYRRSASGLWVLSDRLTSPNAMPGTDAGLDLDTDGQRIIIGAPGDDTRGEDAGAAYIYRRANDDSWIEEVKLLPPYEDATPPIYWEFGWQVAIEDDLAVICEDQAMRLLSGDAFVYRRDTKNDWAPVALLYPSDAVEWVYWGTDVDIENGTIIVGGEGLDGGSVYEIVATDTEVMIDLKPGNRRNVINPYSKGRLWIAIVSDETFDALQVDRATVALGPGEASPDRYRVKDVNRDRLPDLMLRFRTPEVGLQCGDTEVELTGETYAGDNIIGTDAVKTVGCKKKPKKGKKK